MSKSISTEYNEYDQNRIDANPKIEIFMRDISSDVAERAFFGTSHFPERAASFVKSGYASSILNDLEQIRNTVKLAERNNQDIADNHEVLIDEWFNKHRQITKQATIDYLHSHSNVASSFIVGPANFPVARNQKRMNWADNKYNKISEVRERSKKRISKKLFPYGFDADIRSDDPNAVKKLDNKADTLSNKLETMKKANAAVRKFYKQGQPKDDNSFGNAKNALMELGYSSANSEALLKPKYDRVIPYESFELTNLRNRMKTARRRANVIEAVQAVEINDSFDNGITVSISDDQKIVIEFPGIPDQDTRTKLKSHAFKWSRYRQAWVRKMTANALGDYRYRIKPILQDASI